MGQKQTDVIENLIFEGVGVRELAYPSALAELDKHHHFDNPCRYSASEAIKRLALIDLFILLYNILRGISNQNSKI